MSDTSTPRNLEFHRKQAKQLLKEVRSGSPAARRRFEALDLSVFEGNFKLSQAHLVVARENGFSSWSQLKRHLEHTTSSPSELLQPYVRELDWYHERAEGLLRSHQGGMKSATSLLQKHHPQLGLRSDTEAVKYDFKLEDALLVQARQHGFADWAAFTAHIEELSSGKDQEPFLRAFEALQRGDDEELKRLLNKEPSLIAARGTNGNNLLNLALSFRRRAACRMLLESGASVNQGNNYGWTPLHQAALGTDVALAEELIGAGGDLTLSARGEGGTPLVQALFWGNDVMADALARHDVTPRNLRVAAGLGRLDLLTACFDSNENLTNEAVQAREFYRPHGEFPEWTRGNERQGILDEAFTYACRNGRTHVLQFLLDRGANIAGDPYQGTGFIWACTKNRRETMQWLLDHGANINQQATFGGRNHGVGVTALHLAVQEDNLEKVRLLVERGADPDISDHLFNATALGWAEFFNHKAVAAYLLDLPNVGVLNLAARGLTERLKMLLEAQPEWVNGSGHTSRFYPLHRAVENRHFETAKLLLEKGADPNRRIYNGKTALDMAAENEDDALADSLRSYGATGAGGL